MSIYPNPARDYIIIDNSRLTNKSIINIYDQLGKLVVSSVVMPVNSNVIDVNHLSSGVYTISVINELSSLEVKLIINR